MSKWLMQRLRAPAQCGSLQVVSPPAGHTCTAVSRGHQQWLDGTPGSSRPVQPSPSLCCLPSPAGLSPLCTPTGSAQPPQVESMCPLQRRRSLGHRDGYGQGLSHTAWVWTSRLCPAPERHTSLLTEHLLWALTPSVSLVFLETWFPDCPAADIQGSLPLRLTQAGRWLTLLGSFLPCRSRSLHFPSLFRLCLLENPSSPLTPHR